MSSVVPLEPFENKVFKPRRQGPGKRSLPGRPLEAQDPGKRSLPGRPTKAFQGNCRDARRVPARPGERQAPRRDKTSTAARRLPRQATTPQPTLQLIHQRVALGPFQTYVARGCAARGMRWQSNADKIAIVANGGAPDGPFLHCLGDADGHLMPLSPAVRVRYDTLYEQLYQLQRSSIFTLAYVATC